MFAPRIEKPRPKAVARAAPRARAPVRPAGPARPLNGWAPNARSSQQIASLLRGVIQRKCASGGGASGGTCASCEDKEPGRLQRKLAIGPSNDPLEHEADRVAEQALGNGTVSDFGTTPLNVQRRSPTDSQQSEYAPPSVGRALATPGRPLDAPIRRDMETRFGHDFSQVRVHQGGAAEESARDVGALAYTVGRDIVFGAGQFAPATSEGRKLLAHELVHSVQQSGGGQSHSPVVQRKIILKGMEAGPKARTTFMKSQKWTDAALAQSIMDDMASAGDVFDFANETELRREIVKRMTTVRLQKQSQNLAGKGSAFGYPFDEPAELYGPRVNWKARDHWLPKVPDDYEIRTDKAKNKKLRGLPRRERCTVYGDQCGSTYAWHLSNIGRKDPYNALLYLFAPQPPHKRTLFHCDYLTTAVHFLSFAESIGQKAFNARIDAYGVHKIVLYANGTMDLGVMTAERLATGMFPKDVKDRVAKRGLGSLQGAAPTSEADLVLGDHVIFWNHLAYDLLNAKFGNAWRLENAIVVERNRSGDKFLGHGSGLVTRDQMHGKLTAEYNRVAKIAIRNAADADSNDAASRKKGEKALTDVFPNVKRTAAGWKVQGIHTHCKAAVDMELREIWPNEVSGLKDPCNPSKLNFVRRPIESAK
jgi:Domain of unknown function (DUF4157)/Protein-glutamine gamma-glutamyltransferase